MTAIVTLEDNELDMVSGGGNYGIVYEGGSITDKDAIKSIQKALTPKVPRYIGKSRLTHDPKVLALRP